MNIHYLADRPWFLATLAAWHHQEWSAFGPGDSVEARLIRLQGWCNRERIPLTVIAEAEGELLGSASLIEHDMDSRLDLSPWLAGVFVAPEHRRRGVGSGLVRRVMEEAGRLQVPKLYLYTVESTAFYARLGWSFLEKARYRGKDVSIMSVALPTSTP